MSRVELNITYDCNLKCQNCNRLCNLTRLDGPMAVAQVSDFALRLSFEGRRLSRVKIVGGEPTIHPDFQDICLVLSDAVRAGLISKVKVNTNGVRRVPDPLPPGVSWSRSPPTKKAHRPFLWSPRDMGLRTRGPCKMPFVCGFSLDSRGWLPCSAAPAIVRMFDLMHLYRPLDGPIPTEVWGMEELCPDCIHSVPGDDVRGRRFGDAPMDWLRPTPRWSEALERHGIKT